jgi:hypothetical protein
MSDPNYYRFYECNLDCYKLKAEKEFRCPKCMLGEVTTDKVTSKEFVLSPSYIETHNGFFSMNTTHTFTPAELECLGSRNCSGELTLFLNNDVYASCTLCVVVKAGGVILQTLIYQRVGNYTSISLAASGNNNLILTCDPAAEVRWIFRGI